MNEFVILGATALHNDGRTVPLGTAKQRGFLALLLYYAGEPVPIDLIVEHLWDGRTVDECREYLYSFASRIRSALAREGIHRALIRLPGGGAYRLDVDLALIDFHRFRRAVIDARQAISQGDHHQAVAMLIPAIGMWRAEPLSDLRSGHADHLRRYMHELLLSAYKLLGEGQLKSGDHHSALSLLEPLVREHELDETLAQLWVAALCAGGRDRDARTFLVGFRRGFRREMQSEPHVELPAEPHNAPGPHRAGTKVPRPRQLPSDINDFTGHQALIAELDVLLDPRRPGAKAVAISGMPGIGKTTLAVHWAHLRRHWFPDGQLRLNLSGYGPGPPIEPQDALSRLVTALSDVAERVPTDPDQLRDRFNHLLGDRRILILLDNVADSDQVRPLLSASDTCATLITSRNRLRGLSIRDGVRNMTVAPLPDQEALTLLGQIIGSTRAAKEPDAVGLLAKLSGGLPLALRIVAVHVADRPRASISDLADELSNHILDADGDTDSEDARIRSVFAWSYRALEPETADAFRILSLHPGASISAHAAAALLDTDLMYAERLLNRLAGAHLISYDTARRYRFHDLLRLYAAERLAAEDTAERQVGAVSQLLDEYLRSAVNAASILAPEEAPVPDLPVTESVRGEIFSTEAEAMRWCETERANLIALTRWAATHGFPRHAWQIPGTLYVILDRYGRQEEVLELQEFALAAAHTDGHRFGQIGTLNNLGASYFAIHDYARAVAHWQECLRLAREVDYRDAESACLHNLASAHLKLDDVATGVGLLSDVIDDCRKRGDLYAEASALHRLGEANKQLKKYEQAAEFLLKSLAMREQIGLLRGQGVTHGALAALYVESGRPELAYWHCRQALDIYQRIKDDGARCDSLITMADAQRALGKLDAALQSGHEALAIGEEIADAPRQAWALAVLAHTHATNGSRAAAMRSATAANAIVDEFSPIVEGDYGQVRQRIVTVGLILRRPA